MRTVLRIVVNLPNLLPDFGLAFAFLAIWTFPHTLAPQWAFGDAFLLVFMDCVVISLGLGMVRLLSQGLSRANVIMSSDRQRAFVLTPPPGEAYVSQETEQRRLLVSNERKAFYVLLIPYALGALLGGAIVTGSLWPFGAFIMLAWRKRRGLALQNVSNSAELDEAAIRELVLPAGWWAGLVAVMLLAAVVGAVPDFALSPEAVAELFPDLADDGGSTPKVIAFGFLYYLGWGILNAWAVLSPGRDPLSRLCWPMAEQSRKEQVSDYLIDLNRASPELLETLPGIGSKRAADIVRYRTATPFQTVDDLANVSGVSPKTLESIRHQVKT